ncbi:cytochrome P450 4C1-like isoform X2 [Homarus americanus]|uniref:cytochrome P450 4C1-like isoform X2 n=1 Tax=Homarus americanus TaxID=6706 RepID=UPI001C48D107|nr:cytochrome P450 4C1-like isoform X2 [Homarus americanus]
MAWLREQMMLYLPNLVTYISFTAFIVLSLTLFFKRQQKVWMMDKIPGPRGLPLLGSVLDLSMDDMCEAFARIVKICKIGPVTKLWIYISLNCLLSGAEGVQSLLTSQENLDKSAIYNLVHPWLGQGLLTSTGSRWQTHRKLLTPAFHFKILEEFMGVFNSQGNKLVQKLHKKADGQPFDIFSDITLCVLDILCESAMGRSVNAQDSDQSDFIKAVFGMGRIFRYRKFRPWLHSDFMFWLLGYAKQMDAHLKVLHDMSYSTIKERRKARLNTNTAHHDQEVLGKKNRLVFLDLLLEYADKTPGITDEDIRQEVDTFLFAGHDTTASAINWALYLLGHHPEIQARVQEELDGIFEDSDGPVTMADLREMKYLENCIKETLRLYPPVPSFSRELTEDLVIDNFLIPAGTTVSVMTYSLHRDPKQFPDPEKFDPDRFLPENARKRHPFAYVPFSAGPRNCIGQKFAMMELKVVLSKILRTFLVESVVSREKLRIYDQIVLKPEGGNFLRLFPRVCEHKNIRK